MRHAASADHHVLKLEFSDQLLKLAQCGAIADQQEVQQTQFFFAVGFNFNGKEHWRESHIVNRIWEKIHNRVTANVLNRFKQDCEARFEKILTGETTADEVLRVTQLD